MTTPQPAAAPPKEQVDVYVRTLNVLRVGMRTQEVADGVHLDWSIDHHGVERLAGVEVIGARGVEVDGLDVKTGRPHGVGPAVGGAGTATSAGPPAAALLGIASQLDSIAAYQDRPGAMADVEQVADSLRQMAVKWPVPQVGTAFSVSNAPGKAPAVKKAATPGEPSPPVEPSVCCDELNPDTGYRCRRTPIHDAGKSIRKHVQINKLGQVDWWITPARALLSGGEQP